MIHTDRHSKKGKAMVIFFPFIMVLLYALWWTLFVYTPYCKKRDSLQPQISALKQPTEQKMIRLGKIENAEEHIRSSMAPIQVVGSRVSHLEDITKFMDHIKEKGVEHDLIVEDLVSDPYLSQSPYHSEALIQPVNLTFNLKGDFLSVGKYIQYLDEEYRHFCHIRDLTLERSSARHHKVLAHIKMEIFCQKQEGKNNDSL